MSRKHFHRPNFNIVCYTYTKLTRTLCQAEWIPEVYSLTTPSKESSISLLLLTFICFCKIEIGFWMKMKHWKYRWAYEKKTQSMQSNWLDVSMRIWLGRWTKWISAMHFRCMTIRDGSVVSTFNRYCCLNVVCWISDHVQYSVHIFADHLHDVQHISLHLFAERFFQTAIFAAFGMANYISVCRFDGRL